jgi:hypothetical protein
MQQNNRFDRHLTGNGGSLTFCQFKGNNMATEDNTSVRMAHLMHSIRETLGQSVESLTAVDVDLGVVAINARIQAARIGSTGAGVKIIAHEMEVLAAKAQTITKQLNEEINQAVKELLQVQEYLNKQVRGRRLAQMASSCIDTIDRNLYERSCDVRWWATGASVENVFTLLDPERLSHATQRMATILKSYTVYFDIILCDLEGTVICNGHPEQYRSVGLNVRRNEWFLQARQTNSGAEYGFEGPFDSPLANGARILVYSCGVWISGKQAGVMGVVFNWDALGQEVLRRAQKMLASETGAVVDVFICRPDGFIVAAADPKWNGEMFPEKELQELCATPEHFRSTTSGKMVLTSVGISQGYETYRTGWIAVIRETV